MREDIVLNERARALSNVLIAQLETIATSS